MLLVVLLSLVQIAQPDMGELRLTVRDPSGLPIPALVEISGAATDVHRQVQADAGGVATVTRLPYGTYRIRAHAEGFADSSLLVEIRSALPTRRDITLALPTVQAQVSVGVETPLVDLHRTGTANAVGPEAMARRAAPLPGRAIPDVVDEEPGWLLEANGVLHPRGSEYQTQYVLDGIPLTDNRSPAFAPEIDAEDVHALNVLTGGYPAEYGRKLGGVVEVLTAADPRTGLHGNAVLSAGSFATAGGYGFIQYGGRRTTVSGSANIDRTDRHLDPPVEENYTNRGTGGSASARFERELTSSDRVGAIVRAATSKFLVPNERIQEQAGQRQDRSSREAVAQLSYQHIFSADLLGEVRGMARGLSAGLRSNAAATPVDAWQDRALRDVYLKATLSAHSGVHEWKSGVEFDGADVRERFGYRIADMSRFDPGTTPAFSFADRRPDREVGAFIQDQIRAGAWTVNAGVRWDRYRLVVDESAVSPRLAIAWAWPQAQLSVRASYDRAFQTPAVENLLLASSASVESVTEEVVRLPVRPSRGNFYELGMSKAIAGKLRLDLTHYRRDMSDFADDDLLLNTGVSFPIAFSSGRSQGTEVKIDVPRWGAVSGFLSYGYMRAVAGLPVAGGLLLGDEAASLLAGRARIPATQDQRNTLRLRFSYQIAPRCWAAAGAAYGSGLPVEFTGDREQALAAYGTRIVDRVDLARGRVRPSATLDASLGIVVAKTRKGDVRLQADARNVTNRLNVINFAGLFSGTALAPPRSLAVRVQTAF